MWLSFSKLHSSCLMIYTLLPAPWMFYACTPAKVTWLQWDKNEFCGLLKCRAEGKWLALCQGYRLLYIFLGGGRGGESRWPGIRPWTGKQKRGNARRHVYNGTNTFYGTLIVRWVALIVRWVTCEFNIFLKKLCELKLCLAARQPGKYRHSSVHNFDKETEKKL